MRGAQLVLTVWILSLPLLVCARGFPVSLDLGDLPVPKFPITLAGLGANRGEATVESSTLSTSFSTSSVTSSLSTATSNVLGAISPISSSSTLSTPTSISELSTSATIVPSTTILNGLGSSNQGTVPDMSETSEETSSQHRTLIIVLSTVLGSVTIILIAVGIFLSCRYRKGRAPFRQRGATPIDDDEIESWRGTGFEQKQQSPKLEARFPVTPRAVSIDSIALKHSPQWSWPGSPNGMHAISSPSMPEPPALVARMPNSRVGLTDEAVPGEDAFVQPMKRQSSRLSKAPPGHARTKSRRSSISTKSMRSYNGGLNSDSRSKDKVPAWYDPDNDSVGTALRDTDYSSPGTSIFDGLNAGGLSPRPKSKSQLRSWDNTEDIGRAIA